MARIEVAGLRELGEAMKKLSSDVQDKVGRAAMAAGSRVVRDAARAAAPQSSKPHQLGVRKNEIVQPGNLKKNIIVKRLPNSETSLTQQYIVAVRHGSGKAGRDAFYWTFLEFGTQKLTGRPFLEPALENNTGLVIDKVTTVLRRRIEKSS